MHGFKLLLTTALASGLVAPGLVYAQDIDGGVPPGYLATRLAVGKLVPAPVTNAGDVAHLTLTIAGDRSSPIAADRSSARLDDGAIPWAVSTNRLGVSAEQPAVDAAVTTSALGTALFPQVRKRRAPGVALMLVGAAGIVTGLLVDESAITIAGAVVGGIGLYLYLR